MSRHNPLYLTLSPDWLQQRYDETHSPGQMAKEAGVSVYVIDYAFYKYGIARTSKYLLDEQTTPDEVRKLYHNDGMSQEQIGIHFGCASSTVGDYMRRHKIERRPKSRSAKALRRWLDPSWCLARRAEGLSYAKIAELAGCHQQTIVNAMRSHSLLGVDQATAKKLLDPQACSPACPGYEQCLNPNGKCIYYSQEAEDAT